MFWTWLVSNASWLIPSLFGLAGVAISSHSSKKINEQNIAYQENANQQVIDQNANATQIRAEDLEKAGLSKTLAAGSPAANVGQITAPQSIDTSQQKFNNLISVANMMSNLSLQSAQADNLSAGADYTRTQNGLYEENMRKNWESLSVDVDYKRAVTEEQRIVNQYKGAILQNEVDLGFANILSQYANIDEVKANTDLILKKLDTEYLSQQKLSADIKRANLDYAGALLDIFIKEYDFGIYSSYGYTSDGPLSDAGRNSLDTAVTKAFRNSTGDNTGIKELRKERWKEFGQDTLNGLMNMFRFGFGFNTSNVNSTSNSTSTNYSHIYRGR